MLTCLATLAHMKESDVHHGTALLKRNRYTIPLMGMITCLAALAHLHPSGVDHGIAAMSKPKNPTPLVHPFARHLCNGVI